LNSIKRKKEGHLALTRATNELGTDAKTEKRIAGLLRGYCGRDGRDKRPHSRERTERNRPASVANRENKGLGKGGNTVDLKRGEEHLRQERNSTTKYPGMENTQENIWTQTSLSHRRETDEIERFNAPTSQDPKEKGNSTARIPQ